MTGEVCDIIRSAVTLAKTCQIRRVKVLRARLLELYPEKEAEISEALTTWANFARNAGRD